MYVRAWHSKTNTCPLRWSDKNIGLGVWLKAFKPDTVAEDYTHSWYLHIRTLKPHCSSSQRLFPKQHQEDRNQSQARFTRFYNYYILKWSWVHFLQKLAELHIPSSSGSSNGLRWLGWRSTSGSSKGLLFMAGAISWSSSSRKFSLLISSVAKEFNKKLF